MRATGWWDERIVGGFMSYWAFQHLGNLAPEDREEHELWREVRAAEGDAGPIVREFAFRADREVAGARWSFRRDLGRTRVVVMDSRAGRVLAPERRAMVDDEEWGCIERWTEGDFDHVLLATSLPAFLGRGLHFLEAWNEAVCAGAWGGLAAQAGRAAAPRPDLEHWAAFGTLAAGARGLLVDVADGRRGAAPGSVVLLSGDVHHAYLAEARRDGDTRAPIYQAVCSPLRNPLDGRERQAVRIGLSRGAARAGRALARAAGVEPEPLTWGISEGPWFDNQLATLDLDGRRGSLRIERAVGPPTRPPALESRFVAAPGLSIVTMGMEPVEAMTSAARAHREQELLRRIPRRGDLAARDQLAEEMIPLARALAGRYAGRGEPLDDLVQVACVGIMKAIDGFDVSREVRFSSYATPTVLGEIRATSATRRGPCACRAASRSSSSA
jgi:hypothetical protein